MEAQPRDLRIVAAAIAVSSIGDWVAVLTLALRANEVWHGFGVSILLIALWSPVAALIIFGLLGVYYMFEHLPSPAEEPAAGKPPDG